MEKQTILDRINSIDDAIALLGEDDNEVIRYKKLITVLDDEDHLVNYQKAVLLVRAVNEKREPNWDNSNEYKYQNWYFMGSSGFRYGVCDAWDSGSCVGSRLCFFDPAHGEGLVRKFPDVFKNFMLIKK